MSTQVSDRKLKANGENAKKSTGPKSKEGKARAALNSLKHGIFAKHSVMTDPPLMEDVREFVSLLQSIRAQFNPVGVLEDATVQQIADVKWNQARLARYQAGVVSERYHATFAALGRAQEEQTWTDLHQGEPALPSLNSGELVTAEMVRRQVDLLSYFGEAGADFEANESFLAFVRDTRPQGERGDGGDNRESWAAEVRSYLGGIPTAERERFKQDFLSKMNSDLTEMYTNRVNAARANAAFDRSFVPGANELEKIMRYSSFLSRQEDRLIAMLLKLQGVRRDRNGGGA
jgi:hypothetical protein